MRAPMRLFISSSFFSLSSKVEGSMLGKSLRATWGQGGGGRHAGFSDVVLFADAEDSVLGGSVQAAFADVQEGRVAGLAC